MAEHVVRGALAGAIAAAAAVSMAAPAAGAPPAQDRFHEEFTEIVEDFCGAEALTVEHHVVVDGHVLLRRRGGLAYFQDHITATSVTTNSENGAWVRLEERVNTRDQTVVDNGDGTLSVIVLATGNSVLYDSDGRAISRDPGQVRFELLIDHGGTVDDASDDEVIEFVGVIKDSTGRSDDHCVAGVEELT